MSNVQIASFLTRTLLLLKHPRTGRSNEKLMFTLMPGNVMPKEETQGLVEPFWCVSTTHDQEAANMEVAPELSQTDHSSNQEPSITIPTMRNTVPIKPGDQLKVFKEKVEQTLDLEEIKVLEPAPKRRRCKQP